MRYIVKRGTPRPLINWERENQNIPENLVYNKAGFPLAEVREALLEEQSHLCAYTMKRLKRKNECPGGETGYSCHIEHWLPQSRRVFGEDIDYLNLVACFPPSKANFTCEYGAHRKGSYDPLGANQNPLISPLQAAAATSFKYHLDGTVEGKTTEAKSTIYVMNLNAKILVNDRKAAIQGWLEPRGKRVSAARARRVAQELTKPDDANCLEEFCSAIIDVATQIAEKDEKRSRRVKGLVRS